MAMGRVSINVGCLAALLLMILGGSAAYSSMEDLLRDAGDQPLQMAKRYPDWACRNCMHNSLDWSSCISCYSGSSGMVPYYGSFNKRVSELAMPEAPPLGALQLESMSKRGISSFLVCRCCMSLRDWRCCGSCGFGAYYGVHGKRSVQAAMMPTQKRSYETSFLDMNNGNGYCSCCNPRSFDYVCCVTQCSKKRK